MERIESALDRLTDRQKAGLAIGAGIGAAAAVGYCAYRAVSARVPRSGKYAAGTLPAGAYDAVIIGSGPSGSTCAFYMARAGARVALLDKEHFPRVRARWLRANACCQAIMLLDVALHERAAQCILSRAYRCALMRTCVRAYPWQAPAHWRAIKPL